MTERAEAQRDAQGESSGTGQPDQMRPCWGCLTPTTGVIGLLHQLGPMWLPHCGECHPEPLPKGSRGVMHPDDLLALCKHMGAEAPSVWVERSDGGNQWRA